LLEQQIQKVDRFQRKHSFLAFLYAVYKKSSEDRVSSLAALFAYYALFSIFPLLLVMVSVLGVLLTRDSSLRAQIVNSALANFPIIGPQLKSSVHGLKGNGVGIGIGTVTLLLASRSLASLAIRAMNDVWNVPDNRRMGFPKSVLTQLLWTVTVGVGVTVSTFFSTYGSLPLFVSVAVAFGINGFTFTLASRVILGKAISVRQHLVGSVLAAFLWGLLQAFGGVLIERDLSHASSTYGFFAIVIGLCTWMYLQAYLTLLCAEADVVREKRLWPRSVVRANPTDGDRKSEAFRLEQITAGPT
jgi:membrane protein